MRTRAATLKVWVALLAVMSAAAMVVALAVGSEPAKAAFPGSNGAIAFEKNDQIYRMSPDGFGQTQLPTSGPLAGTNTEPTWSSDGKKIAFANSTNYEVYWMNSDGTGTPKNLTNDPASDKDPSFFPDYHTIAFVSNRDGGDDDIFKMTVDDTGNIVAGPTQLTTSAAQDTRPAVSPNGKKLAFAREVNGNTDIYVINASFPESSTNKAVRLTKSLQIDTFPEWSPSGKRLALVSSRSGNQYDIFVMKSVQESRTNRPKNLTSNPGLDNMPAWSPDGTKIAFMSTRDDGNSNIFVMHADGTHQTDITNISSGYSQYPSWQPNP